MSCNFCIFPPFYVQLNTLASKVILALAEISALCSVENRSFKAAGREIAGLERPEQ
jgi:hypothetical protein